jgi:phospholipid transport system substrate-binding protein
MQVLADEINNTAVDPKLFIDKFIKSSVQDIITADIEDAEKKLRFRSLLDSVFDIPSIGRFVLGRYWNRLQNQERDVFLSLFKDVIIQTWSRRFSDYNGQTINVTGTLPDGEYGIVVNSVINGNTGVKYSLQWRLRQRDEGLRIVDIIVEGISMAITYRQDYSSIIRKNGGIDSLLDQLGQKISLDAPTN